jgi:hypothetical protein
VDAKAVVTEHRGQQLPVYLETLALNIGNDDYFLSLCASLKSA